MKFEMWSFGHILYMLSPFIIFAALYFVLRGRSAKVINTVGYVLGGISIAILLVRNIDIFVRSGWDLEIIPLQVCHIGNIVAGLALILKKKWLILTAFCFNVIPAFLAMLFADSLANYDTILKIRAQAYVWGHIMIIVCALYAVLVYLPKFNKKDLYRSLAFVGGMAFAAIICNSLFRVLLGWEPNYFYLFNYNGTPLKFLYEALPTSHYGWFEINWFYTLVLLAVFSGVFVGMYFLAKWLISIVLKKAESSSDDSLSADIKV